MQGFLSVDPLAEDFAAWSPYNYVLNNPVLLTDPDGRAPVCETCKNFFKASVAYVAGVSNAIASNFTGNAPGTRGDPADFGNFSEFAAAGQNAGDIFSVAIGTVEQVGGVVATVGGVAGTPVSFGTSLTVAAAGTAAVVHGSVMTQAAMQNLLGGDGSVVNADGAPGDYSPGDPLPRDRRSGDPLPDPEATGAHSRIGTKESRRGGSYTQAREFDADGNPVRDIDFTDHGRPQNHTNPHQHRHIPQEQGGTRRRGSAEPLDD